MNTLSLSVLLRTAGCIFLAASLSACMTLPGQQVRRFIDIPEDRVVLVGRIELHSPLGKDEQFLKTSLGKSFTDRFVLYCSDGLQDFASKEPTTFEGSFSVELERPFYLGGRQ